MECVRCGGGCVLVQGGIEKAKGGVKEGRKGRLKEVPASPGPAELLPWRPNAEPQAGSIPFPPACASQSVHVLDPLVSVIKKFAYLFQLQCLKPVVLSMGPAGGAWALTVSPT